MKTLHLFTILGLALGLMHCKPERTEDIIPLLEKDKVYGHLKFEDRTNFERIITDTSRDTRNARILNAQSSSTFRSMELDNLDEDLKWFASFLSDEGLIEIGNHLYQISFVDSTVLVAPKANVEVYDSLASNLNPSNAYHFSFSDDVLDLVEAGIYESQEQATQRTAAILCGGGCGSYDPSYSHPIGNGNYYVMVNRYLKAGIYFELSHSLKYYLLIDIPGVSSKFMTDYYYEQNCKNGKTRSFKDQSWVDLAPTKVEKQLEYSGDVLYTFKNTIYTSTRGLKKIYLNPSYLMYNIVYSNSSKAIRCRY